MNCNYSRSAFYGVLAIVTLTASFSRGDTVLIFENSSGFSLGTIDSSYGGRVTANLQGGFRYGGAADTPNIVTSYSPSTRGWPSGYGDLQNVAYTGASNGILQLTLSADPGYMVQLHSFDLAGWNETDYVINSVQVLDGNNQLLFSQLNASIQGDLVGARHSTFNFPALTSQVLSIRFDASNLTQAFQAEVIGLDNVRFSQVPEPSSLALGFVAIIGMLFVLQRKRCQTLKR